MILGNHMLYCTVCDNNNGNCTVHNTTAMLARGASEAIPFKPKPYEADHHQSLLSLRSRPVHPLRPLRRGLPECPGERDAVHQLGVEHPRVLWDGGKQIGGSSCVSCGHCVTVCPCNALMEKSMLGHAGFLTASAEDALEQDDRRGQRRSSRRSATARFMPCPKTEAAMREVADQEAPRRSAPTAAWAAASMSGPRTGTSSKSSPQHGPANGISTCVKGKFGWDLRQQRRPSDHAPDPRRQRLPRGELGRSARCDRRPP